MAKKKVEKNNTINIKSQPVQAHIGAARFANDDWGTIAFSFPRTDLSLKFIDKELRYNSIYFLFGYEDGHEVAYVGQASKRKNGESALVRLREHDKSTTEPYRDKWSWVIVVTNKDDTWGATELNALESIFIQEVPEKNNLNGRGQNNGGADISLYEDKVTQIKALITAIGFKIFEDIPEKENIQVISEVNEYSIVEDLQNGMARIPEIVTPDKIVKAMVDMLPAEVWNSKTKFLDPACKGGEYLREIYDRLMENETMQSDFPNDIARSNHILKNQIYGIALSQVSLDRTTKKLFGEDRNIKIIPDYINKLKGINMGSRPDGKQNNIGDILNKEFGKDMEFDVVIGNPPYQEESGGRNAKPLYNDFVRNMYDICSISCFITPSRWVTGGIGLDSFREWMLSLDCIQYIRDFRNATKIFNGVIISGGVMYYLINKSYHGKCNIEYTDDFGNKTTYNRLINQYSIYIRDNNAVKIVDKVDKTNTLDTIMSSLNPFGIDADMRGYSEPTNINKYRLLSSGGYGYISEYEIEKGTEYLPYYKTIVAKALSSKPGKILGTTSVLGPNEVCTFSYFIAGHTLDKNKAVNLEKYLQTRFLRFLLFITTASINTSKKNYEFVPLQDFTSSSDIDWSQSISNIDQQLYKKYNLSDEEIAYIESTIKPME